MELDIIEFGKRLAKKIAQGLPEEEIAAFIDKEILLAEALKANLMEEMNNKTKEFLIEATVKVDTYRYQLQELETKIRSFHLTVDQKAALRDTKMREKIAGLMGILYELDPEKYEQEGITNLEEDMPEE